MTLRILDSHTIVLMVWCAVLDDPRNRPAELKVGPCFLPQVSPPQFPLTHPITAPFLEAPFQTARN
jgi:hypothetical protein